jgi:alkane 1-monooxygenase
LSSDSVKGSKFKKEEFLLLLTTGKAPYYLNLNMSLRAFKYLSPFLLYAGALFAFISFGWVAWLPLIYAWIFIPLAELFIKPDPKNMDVAGEELAKIDRTYDIILYATVPLQYLAIYVFIKNINDPLLQPVDIAGRVLVMGLLCGTLGINVGHELGHRPNKVEQALAKMLLLTSLYMHFFIEHNKGHHKRVATHEDPGSARLNEWVYIFYLRTIIFSYFSAWQIGTNDARKKGRAAFSFFNEMIRFHFIQFAFITVLFFLFGWPATLYFILAAVIGILLLETVNYIEHYGLERKQIAEGKYERALPAHSWNSDHVIGRLMLFELSRHSDHHYLASRKYQTLRHHDEAPQMPTGYPGMMILSLIPPAWIYVMNRRIKKMKGPTVKEEFIRATSAY